MSFKSYTRYKESGVAWLGQVPAHWDIVQVKRDFDVTLGKMVAKEGDEDDRETFPYLRSANVQAGRVSLDDVKQMWLSPDERISLDLQRGDLVICEGGDVGRCAVLDRSLPGFGFQNSVHRVRPKQEADNRILAYWLGMLKESGFIDVICNKATIAHLTVDKIRGLPIVLGRPFEQRLIADFLDREVAKLDSLVSEQERMASMLAEERRAIIAHAVTQGLDPTTPMQESGVEWLGRVPAHWDIVQARRLFRQSQVPAPADAEIVTCFRDGQVTLRQNRRQDGFTVALLEVGYQGISVGQLGPVSI